jgi:large subunit ribosomal protein L23
MALFGNKKTEDTASKTAPKKVKEAAAKKTAPKKEEASVSMQDLYTGAATKTVKAGTVSVKKEVKANNAYRFLVKPLVTEKATNLMTQNKYVFVVSKEANKIEIAKAIEALYSVKPLKVNLSNVKGKKVARGKIRGQRKDWRKAVVTLPAGQTIKIYEGV